jgi:hypothetical protein
MIFGVSKESHHENSLLKRIETQQLQKSIEATGNPTQTFGS